jgi:hypothetical protein
MCSLIKLNLDSKKKGLVHFDDGVNLADEPEAGEEAHGSGEKEEEEHHDERVAKVQESARSVVDLKFRRKVMTTVDEEIDGGEATGEETSPPPVIVLGT